MLTFGHCQKIVGQHIPGHKFWVTNFGFKIVETKFWVTNLRLPLPLLNKFGCKTFGQKAPGVPVTENIVFDFVLWILFQSVLSVIVLSNNFSNILESEGIFLTLPTQRQALCWNIYWFVGQGYYLISCTSRWRWKRRKINVLRDLEENMCNFSPREHFFKTKQNKTKRKKTKQNSKQKKFHE